MADDIVALDEHRVWDQSLELKGMADMLTLTSRPDKFARRVFTVVRRIPPGRVATYGDVAAMAGRPTAWRAVGNIMRACSIPSVPSHRVVAAGGRLGGYGDLTVKRDLLRAEGVELRRDCLRWFDEIRWQRY